MVKLDGDFPFTGEVVWLTPEQGGRRGGPPTATTERDYAATAFVPPHTLESGLASFVLRGFTAGEWRSAAEGRWLIVASEGAQAVQAGSVVVVTEGPTTVGYLHVADVASDGDSHRR